MRSRPRAWLYHATTVMIDASVLLVTFPARATP
jgi:hypothetical protein